MSRPMHSPTVPYALLLLTASLLAPGAALARRSAPDSTPASQISSGERVTGHTHTVKSKTMGASPQQWAPATRQKVQPSRRLPEEPNQMKEQVAPVPSAPVAPGTPVTPGHDVPTPRR